MQKKIAMLPPTPPNQDTNDNLAIGGAAAGTLLATKGLHDLGKINHNITNFDQTLEPHRTALNPDIHRSVDPVAAQQMTQDYINQARNVLDTRFMGIRAGKYVKAMNSPMVRGVSGLAGHVGWHMQNSKDNHYKGLFSDMPKVWKEKAVPDQDFEHHYDMFMDKETPMNDLLKHELQIETLPEGIGPEARSIVADSDIASSPAGLKNLMARLRLKLPPQEREAIMAHLQKVLKVSPNLSDAGVVQKIIGDRKYLHGYSGAYRRLFSPMVGGIAKAKIPAMVLGSAMTAGAIGNKIMHSNQPKQADDQSDANITWQAPAVGLGGLATYHGAKNILNPNRNVAVTYGEMTPKYSPQISNIGGGHKNPGDAVFKLLQQEQQHNPEAAKLNLSKIVRNQAGNIDIDKLKPEYNSIVDTGLGVYLPHTPEGPPSTFQRIMSRLGFHGTQDFSSKNAPWADINTSVYDSHPENKFPVKTTSRIGLMTDAWPAQGATNNSTTPFTGASRKSMLYYGNDMGPEQEAWLGAHDITARKTNNFLTPLLKQEALDAIDTPIPAREKIFNSLKDTYRGTPLAQQLDTVLPTDRIITVSGSNRGDYVGIRAREIGMRLKERGIHNVKVIAQMAQAANDPAQMKMLEGLDNVIAIPRSKQEDYVGLQRIADRHSVSSGTSALSESLAQQAPLSLPSKNSWGYYGWLPQGQRIEGGSLADRHGQEMTRLQAPIKNQDPRTRGQDEQGRNKWTDEEANAWDATKHTDHAQENISTWNKGNLEVGSGMMGVNADDNPDHIIDSVIDDHTNAAAREASMARSKIVLDDIKKGRTNMVKYILDEALGNVKRQQFKGKMQAAIGLGAAGLGGLGIYNRFKDNQNNQQ